MSRSANAIALSPPAVTLALRQLGADLRIARERRSESLRAWAQRLEVSVPTLRRMEAGDAKVSAGVYANALWLIDRVSALRDLAAPSFDELALTLEIARAQRGKSA